MDITIVLPVSRDRYIRKVFESLEFLITENLNVNILTYVDGDVNLYNKIRNLTNQTRFNERLSVYRRKGVVGISTMERRRKRIADIHNEIKEYIGKADYIFIVEDDTIIPRNALLGLLNMTNVHSGIVSGVQLGRHGWYHVGAWVADDVYEPTRIESIENGEGIVDVDATGMYCCLIKKDLYMEHEFEPYEKILGPDVNLGMWLRKQGYINQVNFGIPCGHMTPKETIYPDKDITVVKFKKNPDSKFGWDLSTND